MSKYTQLRDTVLEIRRKQLRAKVARCVGQLGTTDIEAIRCDSGMARPAIYRALVELGYDVPEPLDTTGTTH